MAGSDWIDEVVERAVASERERCAKIAEAHKGSAAKRRAAHGFNLGDMGVDTARGVMAEERGEDIAAEMIAAAIRKIE